MKVILVGPSNRFHGGISSYLEVTAMGLANAGHEVGLILLDRLLPRFLYPGKGRLNDDPSLDYEHENILRPYAFGKVANRNVIFMPVVEGDNLTEYITKNPDLSFEYRAKLCRELCIAVADLHEFGNYLHNDINGHCFHDIRSRLSDGHLYSELSSQVCRRYSIPV